MCVFVGWEQMLFFSAKRMKEVCKKEWKKIIVLGGGHKEKKHGIEKMLPIVYYTPTHPHCMLGNFFTGPSPLGLKEEI